MAAFKNLIGAFKKRMPVSTESKEQPMLAVPAFQLLCFCVTLFVFGGDIGMQLVFAGPVSWGFVTFALACVLVNGFLLFRKAKWLH